MVYFKKCFILLSIVVFFMSISSCTQDENIVPDLYETESDTLPITEESDMVIITRPPNASETMIYWARVTPEKQFEIAWEKFRSVVNNYEPANDLITVLHDENMLRGIRPLWTFVYDFWIIECVREVNGYHYVIFKTCAGNYRIFMYDDNGQIVTDWHSPEHYLSDFEEFVKNMPALGQIRGFDKWGYGRPFTSGRDPLYSYHYTIDGYRIRMHYDHGTPNVDLIKMEIYPIEETLLYQNLLPMDRELILNHRRR